MLIEVCADGASCAVEAERGGAGRIELCAGLVEGGTTPSIGTIAATRQAVAIPIVVLVRPRAGDFLYSAGEIDVMLRDIEALKAFDVHGVAIGVLRPDGTVHVDIVRELVEAARPMSVTFHRAFDLTRDPLESLDALRAAGVDRVLTSGTAATAAQGASVIGTLVEHAGDDLVILAGGRVTADVARDLSRLGVREIHVRGASMRESQMRFRRDDVVFGKPYSPDEYRWPMVDADRVREIVKAVS
jgi:copper homeostasis protein